VLAIVVVAKTGVAHGGRSAVGAAQHDVHALVGQTSHNDYPCLSRCFAISGLAGFCDLISGLQRVRGNILSPNQLADRECNLVMSYEAIMGNCETRVKVR
jgi:hypothetical protein